MSSKNQRSEVWRGVRKKTSGGLTKVDLIKNKRGKIVSKKKSNQAGSQNNLGSWLREKGKKVEKSDMLRKKSAPPPDAPKSKAAPKKPAPKAAPKGSGSSASKKPVKQGKPAPKAAPKPAPVKPKPKKQPAVVRKKAHAAPKRKKVKTKPGINPITQQPYDKREKSGYVEKAKVSLDNVKRESRAEKKRRLEREEREWEASMKAGW